MKLLHLNLPVDEASYWAPSPGLPVALVYPSQSRHATPDQTPWLGGIQNCDRSAW